MAIQHIQKSLDRGVLVAITPAPVLGTFTKFATVKAAGLVVGGNVRHSSDSHMETSHNIHLAIPFFMVTNMEASLQFYVDKIGFTLINSWTPRGKIEWCCLQRDGVSLMLQEPRNKEQFGEMEKGKGISICFQCKDALALYHEFTKHNIEIKEPFVGNNMWVVSFADPDGYRLDFESPTDVAEETNYSDWIKRNKDN